MKKVLCESRFLINLTPEEPLLVKRDKEENIRGRRYAVWFRAFDHRTSSQLPCLPGSSLKGVIRSYAEKILRSFSEDYACDPLHEVTSCSGRLNARRKSSSGVSIAEVSNSLCLACRLFGCTAYAGRVEIDDAFPISTTRYAPQTGIAIDRFTGGVKGGAIYNRKPMSRSALSTVISIKNFELWHLGLLALVLRDMHCGIAKIGSGTRTGYGGITTNIRTIELNYVRAAYGRISVPDAIPGVSALITEDERTFYGIKLEQPMRLGKEPENDSGDSAIWVKYKLREGQDNIDAFFEKCVSDYLAASLEAGVAGGEGVRDEESV